VTSADVVSVDASQGACIDDIAAERFRRDGLLVLRNVIGADELAALQRETATLVERAVGDHPDDPDYLYKIHEHTGASVPFRVEYVVDKLHATKALLGHPYLLRTVEKLQGPAFIPTWDSMVFKTAGAGAAIPWHRDGGLYANSVELLARGRVFNVDIYLDRADIGSCVWALPGSNAWPEERADDVVESRNANGVDTTGAAPVLMEPGDVLLHNVLLLHGSKATEGPLRRVIYYEFRPVDIELDYGPHTPEYVAAKQHVVAAALRHRAAAPYGAGETAFSYGALDGALAGWEHDPETWRYPHESFWRDPATVV
jgi:ectoine hydroxylase-related dioxygenase (phytanoyl-CoA dioxygenase family)